MGHHIDAIDKPGLLIRFMRAFQGDTSYIALEGHLSSYDLTALEYASLHETASLKRQTISPILDFVVAPLTSQNIEVISKAVQRKDGISKHSGLIHVQISKDDKLVFGGYDNFDRDCVFVDGLSEELLTALKQKNMIRGFEPAVDA